MPVNKTGVKKNGLQQYRVRVNYTDAAGKAHQIERTAYGLAEANALEQSLISEYKDKKQVVSRMTVQQLYDEYEVYHSHETRKTSHDSAMKNLRLRVMPTMAGYRLDRLSQPVLAKWKNDIAADEKLSITTKQNAYAAFTAMLNYAVKMEYLVRNPLSALGNFKAPDTIEKPADKLHYYTSEQFRAYIAEAKKNARTVTDWAFYVFFCIAFYTGARKGEINALKWSDIDGNILHIRRSISQKLKGGDVEGPPKNKSSYRDLQIPAPLMKILAEHKRRQQEWIYNTPHRAQLAAMIMMCAGLRRSELLALTWQDIDLNAKTITVNKAVEMSGGKPTTKNCGKTDAAMRTVYIPDRLVNFLREQTRTTFLVCPAVTGKPMTETAWRKMWESYLLELNVRYGDFEHNVTYQKEYHKKHPDIDESVKHRPKTRFDPEDIPFVIPRITAHWLRHTFITNMYLAGVDVLTAKQQAGHSDIKVTMDIYTHLDAEHQNKSMEKLNNFLAMGVKGGVKEEA